MKKAIFVILMTLCLMPAAAQTAIKSVYGVSLGDSRSVVESSLQRQGKTLKNGTTKKGVPYVSIKSPRLGDCTFQGGSFYFNAGTLDRVVFYSSDGGSMDPDFSGPNNAYAAFSSTVSRFQSIYNIMRGDLADKYGSPAIDTEDKCVWRAGKNEIVLTFENKDDTNQYGWHDCWVRVALEYRKRSASNF